MPEAIDAIDAWGAVLLFPARGVPVPSLWELWRGRRGTLASMAWDEISVVWRWKEAISGGRTALFSRWLGGRQAFLAPRLVAAAVAWHRRAGQTATGDAAQSADAARIVAALRERGPLPPAALRKRAGFGAKSATDRFNAAMERLECDLVVATVGGPTGEDEWTGDHHALVDEVFAADLAASPSPTAARGTLIDAAAHLGDWDGAPPDEIARCLDWPGRSAE